MKLFWINFKVGVWNFIEFIKVVFKYYAKPSFAKVDLDLLRGYLLESPFSISKEFLTKRGEKDLYAYGETPLTTLEKIAKECEITSKDKVYELGCGRARTCFWLNSFIGCSVVGIEYIPYFIEQAERIREKYGITNITFLCQDMYKAPLINPTVIYLYGTNLEDSEIKKLVKRFEKLPSGTKIITISYPLTDYSNIQVVKSFEVSFPWGKTEAYLHVLRIN